MATATPPRDNRRRTGATLAFTLVVASFVFGTLGGVIALFEGLSFGAELSLTILPLAVVAPVGGVLGAVFFTPVAVLLAAS
ncbi:MULTISPECIES: hypothetical protein [Halolamina]|uniref:Uncharacterized protein n=1 Tax=Halolamina pelagica TaxID=699431 RepID=A0A1I5VU33_9EURY|nr:MULTISPECIES: hypothetical protein [Halolamina]NHX37866.1 hypothetical protein [Halolamina sp. R1-12]SFQ11084.1 hypothetical protein SAMN05216277_12017 [Halolamina pelagica]